MEDPKNRKKVEKRCIFYRFNDDFLHFLLFAFGKKFFGSRPILCNAQVKHTFRTHTNTRACYEDKQKLGKKRQLIPGLGVPSYVPSFVPPFVPKIIRKFAQIRKIKLAFIRATRISDPYQSLQGKYPETISVVHIPIELFSREIFTRRLFL